MKAIVDEVRSGHKIDVHDAEFIAKVRELKHYDRCVTVRLVANEFDVERQLVKC